MYSPNSQVAKRVVAEGNAEKHNVMINISPNCKGTFPERIGRRRRFSEMTQQHKQKNSVAFLGKMEWTFSSQELPLDNQ